jgi:hypothetical protein
MLAQLPRSYEGGIDARHYFHLQTAEAGENATAFENTP